MELDCSGDSQPHLSAVASYRRLVVCDDNGAQSRHHDHTSHVYRDRDSAAGRRASVLIRAHYRFGWPTLRPAVTCVKYVDSACFA